MRLLFRVLSLGALFFLAVLLLMPFGTTNNAAASALEAWLAPNADLWERWQASGATGGTAVDHGPWDGFLRTYVTVADTGPNRVDYAAVTAADRAGLKAYLAQLQAVAVSDLTRAAQFPYWINLYNAATVDLVLDHYPVETIRDIKISPGLFSFGPWDADLLTVEGESLTLNDIEHRILRPIWRDPRIHYALNCASVGCPSLQPVAFTEANAERVLDAAARAYVNDPRGASVEDGGLRLSSVYNWFMADFGGSYAAVREHLSAYADPPLAARLAQQPRLRGYRYDWSLNDVVD